MSEAETPAERQLREVGVELVSAGYKLVGESTGDSVVLAPDTRRRLEAIIAHMNEAFEIQEQQQGVDR